MKIEGANLTSNNRIVLKSDQFAIAVQTLQGDFVNACLDEINEIIEQEAQEGVSILKKNSMVHGEDYANDWQAKKWKAQGWALSGKGRRSFRSNNIVLHLPKRYRVAHLLEKGAIRAKTGIMKGDGHIAKSFEEIKQNINQKLGGI